MLLPNTKSKRGIQLSATDKETTAKPVLPLIEQLSTFRTETIGTLSSKPSLGLGKAVTDGYKQALVNLVFWYGQWDKNRDYSSVVNASMALGRWGMASSLLYQIPGYDKDPEMLVIYNGSEKLGTAMWEEIRKATGRITPFD